MKFLAWLEYDYLNAKVKGKKMNYVIMSGPALATVASDISYLSLFNVTNDPYLLCTMVQDKVLGTKTIKFADNLSVMQDSIEVLTFLGTLVKQNGGQALTAVNSDAITLAIALKACSISSNGNIKAAIDGIDCVLSAIAPTSTTGVYNTARFTKSMIYGVTPQILANATSVSMVVTKVS